MPEKETQDTKLSHDNLETQFTKTSDRMRYVFGRIEKDYAGPFISFLVEMFQSRPVATTFVTIFAVLSFWPLLIFLGLIIGGFATVLGIGICIALAVYGFLFVVAGCIFLAVIFATLLCSAFLTAAVIFAYSATHVSRRFVTLVRADGRDGALEWVNETKAAAESYIKPIMSAPKPARDDTTGSEDSTVLVN